MSDTKAPSRAPLPEPAAPPPADGTLHLAIALPPLFATWLTARAAAHEQSPAEHAAAIIRHYWAHHDQWRHAQRPADMAGLRSAPAPGGPV